MKILVITEKYHPDLNQRDGGAKLIASLENGFGNNISILQFGTTKKNNKNQCFEYPYRSNDRFHQRIANSDFIINQVKKIANKFSKIIFIHVSMAFSLHKIRKSISAELILFPMFLSPSYRLANENIPSEYIEREFMALSCFDRIISPSHFEKKQLIDDFKIPKSKITVIPRGVQGSSSHDLTRKIDHEIKFCSIGSIKPQKNHLTLIEIFSQINQIYPQSSLMVIGPVQNRDYFNQVLKLAKDYNVDDKIEFLGFIEADAIESTVKDCHIHLSTSLCETFGRTTFETLALGLPNIALRANHAASEFLENRPYSFFADNAQQMINAIPNILENYTALSELAQEISYIYNEYRLSSLLIAEIQERETLAISDFDGTLYHKNDHQKTIAHVNNFKCFDKRVICTARGVDDLLRHCLDLDLTVDWIIANSGAVITDSQGNILQKFPISEKCIQEINKHNQDFHEINYQGSIVQLYSKIPLEISGQAIRVEQYQNDYFYAHWNANKLNAILKLLDDLNYAGRIQVFGDGEYDKEMINFFDGTWIK